MTAPLVSREDTDGIALLVIASPPVNALGLALRRALDEMIRMVNQDPDIRVLVHHADHLVQRAAQRETKRIDRRAGDHQQRNPVGIFAAYKGCGHAFASAGGDAAAASVLQG